MQLWFSFVMSMRLGLPFIMHGIVLGCVGLLFPPINPKVLHRYDISEGSFSCIEMCSHRILIELAKFEDEVLC